MGVILMSDASNTESEFVNCLVCPGCGDEIDPRDASRGTVTENGYCGLMCAMRDAEGDYDDE
jgi:hypothetical protein